MSNHRSDECQRLCKKNNFLELAETLAICNNFVFK